MSEADRFSSQLRGIRKRLLGSGGEKIIAEITGSFVACMPSIPENLKYDVVAYFRGIYAPAETAEEISAVGDRLLEVIYLFEQDYDRVEESLTDDDWVYLRDIVSEFGLELDEAVLTYVMRQVVARGLMGA